MDDRWTVSQIWTITAFDKKQEWYILNRFLRILRKRYFNDFRMCGN